MSILYVWLPIERHGKIYPGAPVYLADHVHKNTDAEQRIFDLSLVEKRNRMDALGREIESFDPGIIAFSWRNIQIFAPDQSDPSLENAFKFYYSRNPVERVKAGLFGIKSLLTLFNTTAENINYINRTKEYDKRVVVGGPAFSIFPEQLIKKLEEGVLGVIGEGENAILKIAKGKTNEELLEEERVIFKKNGKIFKGRQKQYVEFEKFTSINFEYISEIFPQFKTYLTEYIGIKTKRGCPYGCIFCAYPYLEGRKMRYAPPAKVVEEIKQLHDNFGAKKFWFVDSNFVSSKKTIPHCTQILDGVLKNNLDIEWGGYVRIDNINEELARLMLDSGIIHFELSLTSGSPRIIKNLRMGFKLEEIFRACRLIKDSGHRNEEVIINYSLNAPGETKETMLESIETYKKIRDIFGVENVTPYIFFLGIQSHTKLEKYAFEHHILPEDYNPLVIDPRYVNKIIFNPPPLDKPLVRAYLNAIKEVGYKREVGIHVLKNLEKELASI